MARFLIDFAGNKVGNIDVNNSSNSTIAFRGGTVLTEVSNHMKIETMTDGKNVRLNSRNVTQATGDHTAVQCKPNKSVDGTGAITGIEVSPRFAAGIGGSNLRAILADPLLKAGSGDITGSVVGVEVNLDFGVSGTRTITGKVKAFSSFLALPSTYTYSDNIVFLHIRSPNIRQWTHLLEIESGNSVISDSAETGTSGTKRGWLLIDVAGTDRYLRLYDTGA